MPEPTKKGYKAGCIVVFCYLAMFLSILWAAPLAFPIGTNIYQLANSSNYVDTSFTVMTVHYEPGGYDGIPFRWAEGTIESDNSIQTCALIFGYSNVTSEEELQALVPVGTKFVVKYNSSMMRTPIQGSTPRVIINDSNDAFTLLWRSTISYLLWALGPLAISFILVYYVGRPRFKKLKEKHPGSAPVSSPW